jgi:3-dehydroquinate dehydratase-2
MSNKNKILVVNGPNLNLLGKRQPEIYGKTTLEEIENICKSEAKNCGLDLDFKQSNDEADIIGQIQLAPNNYSAIIINAAAYTHTSVAIMDALLACNLPVIEVHLSNIYKREEFRHKSFISPAASGIICGFGSESYRLAVVACKNLLK